MIDSIVFVLGMTALGVVWDIFRRRYASNEQLSALKQELVIRIEDNERETREVKTRVNSIGDLINAAKAGQANRMPPRLRS